MNFFLFPENIAQHITQKWGGVVVHAPLSFSATHNGLSYFGVDCVTQAQAHRLMDYLNGIGVPAGVVMDAERGNLPSRRGVQAAPPKTGMYFLKIHIPKEQAQAFCALVSREADRVKPILKEALPEAVEPEGESSGAVRSLRKLNL